jgi:DNA-binding SARP family transcriptional activator/Tfp pilus assembly protein PilF
MFVVRVLDGLSIDSTAGPVPRGALQRRRLSLVAVLALAGDRGLTRERIHSYLWPESDAARARHALDQLLYTTRRDLGSDVIVSGATELRLNASLVETDIGAFDSAIAARRWEEAVAAYAGPVLSGVHLCDSAELERWVDTERLKRHQEHLRALDALADAATRRGEFQEAVRWRQRQSAADPLSVPIALTLLRALDAAGDRAGALRHARVYQNVVRSTLEMEPDPAVAALANAIAAHSPKLADEAPFEMAAASADVARADTNAAAVPVTPSSGGAPRRRQITGLRRAGVFLVASSAVAAVIVAHSQGGRPLPTLNASAISAAERAGDGLTRATDRTPHPEARVLYLRARALWENAPTRRSKRRSCCFGRRPNGIRATALRMRDSPSRTRCSATSGSRRGTRCSQKARAAAQRAIALDATSGDAYAALGQAFAWEHAWADAEVAYRRALELTPRDATAHQWYALLLAYLGRTQEAVVHTEHASELDPLSVQVNNMHGIMLYYAGRMDDALRQYERTVDVEPDSAWVRRNPWVLTNFSRVAAAAGRHALALDLAERALEVVPAHPRPLFDLAYAHAAARSSHDARGAFARADSSHGHYAVYRALLHATLGERDEAFAWFERVREWPLPSLVTLNCEPRLAALRADARFHRIRERLGMTAPSVTPVGETTAVARRRGAL